MPGRGTIHTTDLPSGRFGRIRNDWLIEILTTIVATAQMLVDVGVVPSIRVANRRLRALHKRGHIKAVGLVETDGRPAVAYHTRHVKMDNVKHHTGLCEFLLPFLGWCEVYTGPDVDEYMADATIIYPNGKRLQVEWDTGSMTYRQVLEQRWPKYTNCPDAVLWITNSETRRDGFRSRGQDVSRIMLFASQHDAIENCFRPVWYAWDGTQKRIPDPVPKGITNPQQSRISRGRG